jgi:hypothetical protein
LSRDAGEVRERIHGTQLPAGGRRHHLRPSVHAGRRRRRQPADAIEAFRDFLAGIKERCEDPPKDMVLQLLGEYGG